MLLIKDFFLVLWGGRVYFFKECQKTTKRSGNTHGLWKLQWLNKQGNRGLKLHWQRKDPSCLWEAEESYFMGGGITLSAPRAEHWWEQAHAVWGAAARSSAALTSGAWRGKQKQSWVHCGDWSVSPSFYLSQLKLLFKLSSIVTYLHYIHKTSSGWAASVKAILDGIRIWTLFCSSIRAREISWHLLQHLFHKTAFSPSTLWKSSPWVGARGRAICKTACLCFQRGAYIWHMWFIYFCGHTALGWISFTRFNRMGFFSQCWDWRIKVVDFENIAL